MVRLSSIISIVAAVAITIDSTSAAYERVNAKLHRVLRQQGTANVMVVLKDSVQPILEKTEENDFSSRGEKISHVVESLQAHTAESQQEVEQLLQQEAAGDEPLHTGYQKYWITNMIYVESATAGLIEKLSQLESVDQVREEEILQIEDPIAEQDTGNAAIMSLIGSEWGVKRVEAPSVWKDGTFGQGIVVSSIDTGVRSTHEALKNNFRRSYGWFDPESKKPTPYDIAGHGTHTMGTIAGSKGVGVAPGATWMTCKGCRSVGCPESDLTACAQFITCPHDTNGRNPDCSKAPHVVSNSWGGGQGSNFFRDQVNAWHKAGIIPVFSIGNSGPACRTANSPGDMENVIGVGATDIRDALAYFSSKGPTVRGLLKPDISAPGLDVRSAWYDSDTGYKAISGTSMACPHVSGAVALLLSGNKNLKYDEVKKLLTSTADRNKLVPTNMVCGNTSDSTWPNNQFGYGRMNAFHAYKVSP